MDPILPALLLPMKFWIPSKMFFSSESPEENSCLKYL
jgi:hypothetical protein